jgi:glutamate synthase (NADPH/NADH) small chain
MNGSAEVLELNGGRLAVNADRQTSLPDVWAGGDCIAGDDLTVAAVQDGKLAAMAIDRRLRG